MNQWMHIHFNKSLSHKIHCLMLACIKFHLFLVSHRTPDPMDTSILNQMPCDNICASFLSKKNKKQPIMWLISTFVFFQNTLSVHSLCIITVCCSFYVADSQCRRRRLAETNNNSSTLVWYSSSWTALILYADYALSTKSTKWQNGGALLRQRGHVNDGAGLLVW